MKIEQPPVKVTEEMIKLLEPLPTGFDPFEELKNEHRTTYRALEWAVTEIERLRKQPFLCPQCGARGYVKGGATTTKTAE